MERPRALIISDSPDRTHFLKYHIQGHGMKPIHYPNHGSALRALEADAFGMVVVDLTLPIESKLDLVKTACQRQKDAIVMTIGKTRYLQNARVLEGFDAVECLSTIQAFPEKLRSDDRHERHAEASDP